MKQEERLARISTLLSNVGLGATDKARFFEQIFTKRAYHHLDQGNPQKAATSAGSAGSFRQFSDAVAAEMEQGKTQEEAVCCVAEKWSGIGDGIEEAKAILEARRGLAGRHL